MAMARAPRTRLPRTATLPAAPSGTKTTGLVSAGTSSSSSDSVGSITTTVVMVLVGAWVSETDVEVSSSVSVGSAVVEMEVEEMEEVVDVVDVVDVVETSVVEVEEELVEVVVETEEI